MMNRRWPDQARVASSRRPARVVQLGLPDRFGHNDQAPLADGSRDGATGITLKPYPPVLG